MIIHLQTQSLLASDRAVNENRLGLKSSVHAVADFCIVIILLVETEQRVQSFCTVRFILFPPYLFLALVRRPSAFHIDLYTISIYYNICHSILVTLQDRLSKVALRYPFLTIQSFTCCRYCDARLERVDSHGAYYYGWNTAVQARPRPIPDGHRRNAILIELRSGPAELYVRFLSTHRSCCESTRRASHILRVFLVR